MDITNKHRIVSSAINSVEVEGLSVDEHIVERLRSYAEGKITAEQLHQKTLDEVKELAG